MVWGVRKMTTLILWTAMLAMAPSSAFAGSAEKQLRAEAGVGAPVAPEITSVREIPAPGLPPPGDRERALMEVLVSRVVQQGRKKVINGSAWGYPAITPGRHLSVGLFIKHDITVFGKNKGGRFIPAVVHIRYLGEDILWFEINLEGKILSASRVCTSVGTVRSTGGRRSCGTVPPESLEAQKTMGIERDFWLERTAPKQRGINIQDLRPRPQSRDPSGELAAQKSIAERADDAADRDRNISPGELEVEMRRTGNELLAIQPGLHEVPSHDRLFHAYRGDHQLSGDWYELKFSPEGERLAKELLAGHEIESQFR